MLDFGFLCCWSPRATPFLLTECCRVLALRGQSTQPSSTRCILTLILIIPRLPVIPPPASHEPSAGYLPPPGSGGSGATAARWITYTPRLGWTNAQGQYCREYKTTQGTAKGATERYGTACRDESGQWRIVN